VNAEDPREFVRGFIHRFDGNAEDEHASLFAHNFNAQRAQRKRDALHQTALKIRAVQPLEVDFRIADEHDCFHLILRLIG